ncbi:MAG TPA: extracellular solute-binding protein, partial [Limnochordia bacterium]|nr:extracellular solute-binding protein [Limnochordia bacterium]
IVPKPAGPGGTRAAQMTQDGFMVYAHTQHPKEAVEFLKFLTSAQAEKIMMLQGNLQPSRLSLGLEYATNTTLAQRGLNMKVFIDQTKYAFSPPFFKNQSKVNDVLYPALDKMIQHNTLPVASGLIDLNAKINAITSANQ